MTDSWVLVVFGSCVITAWAFGWIGFGYGYEQALTDSCQTQCLESGYDASNLEDKECVCIQYSVMEK